MPIPLFGKLVKGFDGTDGIADAADIQVDNAAFSKVLDGAGPNTQAMLAQLNGLDLLTGATLVNNVVTFTRQGQADLTLTFPVDPTGNQRSTRPLNLFFGAITVTGTNFNDFSNRNSVYAATTDQRVNFLLPLEADIPGYPVAFELTNLAGTARFESGATPTNTVVIDTQGGDTTEIENPAGSQVQFAELHRGDIALVTKAGAGQNWIVQEGATDPRSSILPDGLFTLNSRAINVSGSAIQGLALYTPQEGDAFVVSNGGSGFGGDPINAGDVMVAKVDGPSITINSGNEDWLVIRDVSETLLSLTEMRFLTQVTETESTAGETRVDDAVLWSLATRPVTDPGVGAGSVGRITFSAEELNRVFLVAVPTGTTPSDLRLRTVTPAGVAIFEENFTNGFIDYSSVIADAGGRRYYLFGTSTTVETRTNFATNAGYEIFQADKTRRYTFSSLVDATTNVNNLPVSRLDAATRAAIGHATALTGRDFEVLDEMEVSETPTDLLNATGLFWKAGDVSRTITDYTAFDQGTGIPPLAVHTLAITFLVPAGSSTVALRRVDVPSTTATATYISTFSSDDGSGNRVTYDAYSATLPAAVNVTTERWQITGAGTQYVLSGVDSNFKVHRTNLDPTLLNELDGHGAALPQVLTQFVHDLTDTSTGVTTTWTANPSQPISSTLTRVAAAFWAENRQTATGNFFTDVSPAINVTGFSLGDVFYYPNGGTDPNNRAWPGAQSFAYQDNVRLENASGSTPILDDYNKIIAFDYRLTRQLVGTEAYNILRLGDVNDEPLLQINVTDGLVARFGRGDGGATSRTTREFLQVANPHWHTVVGETFNEEAEIIIPDDATGQFVFSVDLHLRNNDNDAGIVTHEFTIADVGVSGGITPTPQVFSFTDPVDNLSVTFSYEHANTDIAGVTRRIVLMEASLSNAAFFYDISAYQSVTVNWNLPMTYASESVNAGDPFDSGGIYDPSRYTTRQANTTDRILMMVIPVGGSVGAGGTNPEMGLRIIVDGELEGDTANDHIVSLGRHQADFDFSDIRFGQGNSPIMISHIQVYDYDKNNPPSENDLVTLYHGINPTPGLGNLGFDYFWPPGIAGADRYQIAAELVLQSQMGNPLTGIEQALINANGVRVDTLYDTDLSTTAASLTFPGAGLAAVSDYDWLLVGVFHSSVRYDRMIRGIDNTSFYLWENGSTDINLVVNAAGTQVNLSSDPGTTAAVFIQGIKLQTSVVT